MFSMYLVSMIIPVYNAEKFLKKCIDSVINQSYTNLEIIIIDDGSTDDSGRICDEYKKMDSRILVIHQKNMGLVRSWKEGVHKSSGQFICFIDADDYIESQYIENLVQEYEHSQSELIVAPTKKLIGARIEDYNNLVSPGTYSSSSIKKQIIPTLLQDEHTFRRSILPNRWGKMFSKELIMKSINLVPDNVTYAEDFALFIPLLLSTPSLSIIETGKGSYIYRILKDSMVRGYDSNRWSSTLSVYSMLFEYTRNQSHELYLQLQNDGMLSVLHAMINELKAPTSNIKKVQKLSMIEHSSLCKAIRVMPGFFYKINVKEKIFFIVLKCCSNILNYLLSIAFTLSFKLISSYGE